MFVETRHVVFLEDEMIRESTASREISLEERWVYVPTPMIHEPTFSMPVVVAPAVQDIMVATSIVSSHVAAVNEEEVHVFQEPVVTREEEQQQPPI
jgi:hypothetical protein